MGDLNLLLVGGGLVIGLLLGIVVQRTQFCMVSAVSNAILMRDFRHADAHFAALAIAILGTLSLEMSGLVAISETAYRVPRYDWPVIIFGGLLFGFGSMLAGGCAGRTTVRASEGNLGALIVLMAFALAAAATFFGVLEPFRVWLIQHAMVELDAGDSSLSAVLDLPLWAGPAGLALICIAGVSLHWQPGQDYRLLMTGAIIGLLVIAGWYVTGYLSQHDFSEHSASSISVAGPLARATVFVTTGSFTGYGFTISVLIGIVAGATGSAIVTRSFHVVVPEAHHLKHLLLGGMFMGVGAICAGGCNIGSGLTGVSTGSIRALTALLAILVGMWVGIVLLTRTEKID